MIDIITITSTNDSDPSCQRLTVVRHFPYRDLLDEASRRKWFRERIAETETDLRRMFPQNMTFTRPFTTVEIMPREVIAIREAA